MSETTQRIHKVSAAMQPPMSRLQHTTSLILIRAEHMSSMDSNI